MWCGVSCRLMLLVRSCVLDCHRCVAGCVSVGWWEKKRCRVYVSSKKTISVIVHKSHRKGFITTTVL